MQARPPTSSCQIKPLLHRTQTLTFHTKPLWRNLLVDAMLSATKLCQLLRDGHLKSAELLETFIAKATHH